MIRPISRLFCHLHYRPENRFSRPFQFQSPQREHNKYTIKLFNHISNVLFIENNEVDQIAVPRELVGHYLPICHDENRHFGVVRISYILRNAWWIGKSLDIVNFVNSCVFANNEKATTCNVAKFPFKILTMDQNLLNQSVLILFICHRVKMEINIL